MFLKKSLATNHEVIIATMATITAKVTKYQGRPADIPKALPADPQDPCRAFNFSDLGDASWRPVQRVQRQGPKGPAMVDGSWRVRRAKRLGVDPQQRSKIDGYIFCSGGHHFLAEVELQKGDTAGRDPGDSCHGVPTAWLFPMNFAFERLGIPAEAEVNLLRFASRLTATVGGVTWHRAS